ncbi:ABC transporter ATP-binding protein [Streptomyces sp. JJ38]|uniref:ABC transporter ATP-binding protein n=1 Tax=Streptomyces sp. JJ38 TaxID=2738128 RepID=UPI001C55A1B6|nr:ATP-binding cassette domain-containing protein [Streptomyces sp. JJ38]MBW1598205.1 ATP-binding cassette domain-containing protein [Streptomyces sp. JJ38]
MASPENPPSGPRTGEALLSARGLHCSYGPSPALLDVSLDVAEGEIVAVTGPRGSGRSTLLHCLSGRLLPHQGEVLFDGLAVHTLPPADRERLCRDRFGWIGDEPALVPELTVWENTALPLMLVGAGRRAARRGALEWLERLDVADCARKRPAELPQARRQRVAVARALVHGPQVLFADEPTAPLHTADRAQVLRTLTTAVRSHGITLVLTGSESGAPEGAPGTPPAPREALIDRTVRLRDGRTATRPTPEATTATSAEDQESCSLSV